MLHRYFTILLSIMIAPFAKGQKAPTTTPDSFIMQQNDMFMRYYEKRDTASCRHQLSAWGEWYNHLTPREQKQYAPNNASFLYNLSCVYALSGDGNMALSYLDQSIKAGYTNYSQIRSDKDLESLQKDSRLNALIKPLQAIGDYKYILRNGGQYNNDDTTTLPSFTYQPADDPALAGLRKRFSLDSIAGSGNDVLKILNLLHWVHILIPHDGNHENPFQKNSAAMVQTCVKDHRGLNCRGLATVLNECYLALGFRSRLVTCLPKDSLGIDPDCHVINMVFIPSLEKWVWVDPTNDAYVMNETGQLMGIEEVRRRIIQNQPLILNPSANWNNRSSTTKDNYLYNYMAKNLYILQCPVDSRYDNETPEQGKIIRYIQLDPLDYFKHKPHREFVDQQTRTTYAFYGTTNANLFWQAPQ